MRFRSLPLLLVAALAAGCSDASPDPTGALTATAELFAVGGTNRNHTTHLRGDHEVPPVDTRAQGQVKVQLSRDGSVLQYKLILANIENVSMAHFHRAPEGVNGPVVVWLYPSGPPPQLIPGRTQGVVAEGEITSASLVGPMAGQSLADLMDEIRSGNIYVNVHTSAWPGGEVRGQLR
jgi:hypothetical protein